MNLFPENIVIEEIRIIEEAYNGGNNMKFKRILAIETIPQANATTLHKGVSL